MSGVRQGAGGGECVGLAVVDGDVGTLSESGSDAGREPVKRSMCVLLCVSSRAGKGLRGPGGDGLEVDRFIPPQYYNYSGTMDRGYLHGATEVLKIGNEEWPRT